MYREIARDDIIVVARFVVVGETTAFQKNDFHGEEEEEEQ